MKKVLFEMSTDHFQADDLVSALQLAKSANECPLNLTDGDFYYALAVLSEYIDALEGIKDSL